MVGRIYGTSSCGSHGFREDVLKFFPHFKSIEAYDSMASIDTRSMDGKIYVSDHKVRKGAKIRNRYIQAPHLIQDTNGKVTTQLDITNKSQKVSPFPAGDHKVSKGAKIRNRYNQVSLLTQDTNGNMTNSQGVNKHTRTKA